VTGAALERYEEHQPARALPLTERDITLIERQAEILSKSSLVGPLKGQPASVALVGIKSHEMGIPFTTGISDLFPIKDQITVSARLRVGLARRAGHKVRFPETTNQACTCTLQRRGETYVEKLRITIGEVPATLKSKDNWKNFPAAMLRAMTSRQLVNMAAQEVLLGIPDYITDAQLETLGVDIDELDAPDDTLTVEADVAPAADVDTPAPAAPDDGPVDASWVQRFAIGCRALSAGLEDISDDDYRHALVYTATGGRTSSSKEVLRSELPAVHGWFKALQVGQAEVLPRVDGPGLAVFEIRYAGQEPF
jgi:hypothetical protein